MSLIRSFFPKCTLGEGMKKANSLVLVSFADNLDASLSIVSQLDLLRINYSSGMHSIHNNSILSASKSKHIPVNYLLTFPISFLIHH